MTTRDRIDEAIAASQPAEAQSTVRMVQRRLTINATGRPVMLAYPADITDQELLGVIAWLSQQAPAMRDQEAHEARSRIVVPGGLVLPS